jgi:hypothetical protein
MLYVRTSDLTPDDDQVWYIPKKRRQPSHHIAYPPPPPLPPLDSNASHYNPLPLPSPFSPFTHVKHPRPLNQDLQVVSSALLKLVGGSQSQAQAGQLSVDEFLQQARAYDRAVATPVGRLLRNQLEPSLTHPLPVLRVRELDRWYNGQGYAGIVSRGLPMTPAAAAAAAAAVEAAPAPASAQASTTTSS